MNVIAKRVTIHISEECNPFSFVFYPIICGKKPSFIISVSILSTFSLKRTPKKAKNSEIEHLF